MSATLGDIVGIADTIDVVEKIGGRVHNVKLRALLGENLLDNGVCPKLGA